MIRLLACALAAGLAISAASAQSVELVMRLSTSSATDAALSELESGAMDRFFDAGLILTSGAEAAEPDIEGLCSRADASYIDWLLVIDVAGAAADLPKGSIEQAGWTLYRTKDRFRVTGDPVPLPRSAMASDDRLIRLRSLGDAVAAAVISYLRSGGARNSASTGG